ncbi:hypothetical protein SFC76_15235 [Sphingomonas sp. CD22]|uniref:hypothetical protein n=1 Tax=Sphingomonas sp. CD22 TaxID=3100214 RepID=UPI002ADF530D|nr:hypothetical protein [Sphingomonas sp. CD22]MEA1085618.1 hypothetical protein [Sphingomonas sp. CD22]
MAQHLAHPPRPVVELLDDDVAFGGIALGDEVERVTLQRPADRTDFGYGEDPLLRFQCLDIGDLDGAIVAIRHARQQPQQQDRTDERRDDADVETTVRQVSILDAGGTTFPPAQL